MAAVVDKKLRRKYFNLCDPRESLPPNDDRNVDVDAVTVEARGRRWVEALANRIELSDKPQCEFFTGLPGSGKSTELRRLAARLAHEDGAHLLPVLIDAEEVLDVRSTIDVSDILMAILVKAEETVLEAEGKSPAQALEESALRRFWTWLTTTEIDLKGAEASAAAEAGVPGVAKGSVGAKVVIDLKARPSLRKKVRNTVAEHVTTFIKQVREAITELDERATRAGYEGLVVLFDSLEKVRGTSESWRDVLSSAERVFANRAADLELPVHVLYTLPTALILRLSVPVTFLPMLKLVDRHGKRAAGYEAAREIVRKRVPDSALNEFFGAPSREARVEQLITWSGGYPREIVRLLQTCVGEPGLDEALFQRLLSLAGDEYCRTVPENAFAWLARVHVDKSLAFPDEQREMVDQMLENNVVLRYQNNEPWCDIHPAVRRIPRIAEEIERLLTEKAARPGPRVG